MKRTVRYLAAAAAVGLFAGTFAASPATADKPVEETVTLTTSEYFGAYYEGDAAFNACTGEVLPTIRVDMTPRNHYMHPNTWVSTHGKRAVNVDDETGYSLSGTDKVTFNFVSGNFSWVLNDTWTAPDGEVFKLHMVLTDIGHTPDFPDMYLLKGHSLGGETILPTP